MDGLAAEYVEVVGREAEVSALADALDAARNTRGGLLLVSGEEGIGKTLLVRSIVERARFPHFVGRASEHHPAPYSAAGAAWSQAWKALPPRSPLRRDPPPALGLVIPELAGSAPADGAPPALVATALADLAGQVAGDSAAVFILEDLHWADSATLELLPWLAERLLRRPALVIGTCRNDSLPRTHRLRWARNELRRQRYLREVTLDRLDLAGTSTIATQALGSPPSPALARAIHDKTHGLALFIVELCRDLCDHGVLRPGPDGLVLPPDSEMPLPETVRDAVAGRMAGLTPQAVALLEACAAAGAEFDLATVTTVAGGDNGADELLARGLIGENGSGIGMFSHSLVREAILAETPWVRRRDLHRRVALELEKRGAPPEQVAPHWHAAGEDDRARAAYLEAADRACRIHAYWDATRLGSLGLELWPAQDDTPARADMMERLARCAQSSGQLVLAGRTLAALLDTATLRQDPMREVRVRRGLASLRELEARYDDARAQRAAALALLVSSKQWTEAATEALAITSYELRGLQYASAVEAGTKAMELARKTTDRALQARTLATLAYALAAHGDMKRADELAAKAVDLVRKHDLAEVAAEVYRRRGAVDGFASRVRSTGSAYRDVVDRYASQSNDVMAHDCLGCLGYYVFRTGDWQRAVELSRQVRSFPKSPPVSRAIAASTLAMIHALRGELRLAARLHDEAQALARANAHMLGRLEDHWVRGLLAELAGAGSEATDHYLKYLGEWSATEDRTYCIQPLCWIALWMTSQDRDNDAMRCSDALAGILRETGNREAAAALKLALGAQDTRRANHAAAARQYEQAADLFADQTMPFEEHVARWYAGTALAATGRTDEAAAHLAAAFRHFRELGARPLAARVAESMASLGIIAQEEEAATLPPAPDYENLTPRQKDILGHIASGLTNKEIAARLFLSPRTVEMHVARILDRLNCRTRAEAVRRAGELKLIV